MAVKKLAIERKGYCYDYILEYYDMIEKVLLVAQQKYNNNGSIEDLNYINAKPDNEYFNKPVHVNEQEVWFYNQSEETAMLKQ